jgi:replicative superfamily II helicase
VVELTGDVTPDMRAISKADVIVTTPEKWDGISRSWQTRNYVQDVALLVIDEIHLLGDERGPVLEVIVSRTNFISSHTEQGVRVVGLSTALANARDLADWLGIKQVIWWWKYSLNFHNHVISNLSFRLDYSTSVHPYVPCLYRFISTVFLANIIVRAWLL